MPSKRRANDLGEAFYLAGQYGEAVEQFQKVLELDANLAEAHASLGMGYAQQGRFQEAVLHLQKAMQLDPGPDWTAHLGHAYALSGNKTEAQKLLTQLVNSSQERYVVSSDIAAVYVALGKQDRACAWLERAYDEHDGYLTGIRVDPAFTKLRSNPCFQSVTRRMGFSH